MKFLATWSTLSLNEAYCFKLSAKNQKNNCSVVTIPGIVKTIACCLSIKQSNCCCTDVSEVFHFTIAQMGWKYLCYLLSLYIFPMGCFLIYLWWVYKWWVEVVVVYGLLITNVFSAMILQCGSYFLLLTCNILCLSLRIQDTRSF